MKINGINNSFYGNNGKVNNQPNFTALKKINFSLDFNPQKSLGDAEVLLEFKKSEPLKRFFEKYDGIADFSESHWSWIPPLATWIRQRAILIIKYNPNPVEKTIQKEIKEPEKIIEKEIKNKGFFNKIKKASSVKIINKNLNYYLITLCLLAFFYIPGESADLTRWREMSEVWSNFDFEWFWEHRIQTSSVPAGYLLVYLCQSTGINGILPMICAFGFFGNIFHMLKNEAKRENVNSDSVALTLFFVISTGFFLEAISGVRCMLAFSIVIRCAYDEMRLNKNIIYNIFFYIFATYIMSFKIPTYTNISSLPNCIII